MTEISVTPIPAFTDNYIWMLERPGSAVVVDPGDAAPVRDALRARRARLSAILVTHHHLDHVGGVQALRDEFDVPVYGPDAEAATIPALTHRLRDGDHVTLEVLGLELEVLSVPGHTAGHIAYAAPGRLFCGDTLFSAGCGRLFEGTPAQMHASLSRLAALPGNPAVYCTHEYTLANLAFAAAVEPDNPAIRSAREQAEGQRAQGLPTLPSSMDTELRINPFLRCTEPAVRQAAARHDGKTPASDVDTFASLRRWKDSFRAPGTP